MTTTYADYIVATLRASGVRRVYGLPGDSLNGFTDALRRDGEIAWQHVRHEETAGFAAAGEAAITGELAVAAASCGPGNLHLINGLWDASRSRVPVLAIAAHIPRDEIGSGYFQETHPQDFYRELAVYTELVSIPEQVPRVLEIAMRTAISRRGVAVVVIPGEVFLAAASGWSAPATLKGPWLPRSGRTGPRSSMCAPRARNSRCRLRSRSIRRRASRSTRPARSCPEAATRSSS